MEFVDLGKKNPRKRIAQHRSGRRSGDQFCVYIQDFYVLPETMSNGSYKPKKKWLDDETKHYIRKKLFYRLVVIENISKKKHYESEILGLLFITVSGVR